ncbi:hypothetical protein EI534_25905 [Pseudomonas frederiksbergensis]|nr:hypothetical protein [Pseudomonas frederiksbergensis]
MSPKLALIARRMQRQTPEQAPAPASDDLAAAIERLVQERVDQAMEQQPVKPPPHVRRLMDEFNRPAPITDYRDLAPAPRTPAPKKPLNMLIHRDGADKILWCEMSDGTKVELIRDRAGKTIAMKEMDESPVLPALDVPYKAEARQYRDGEPR